MKIKAKKTIKGNKKDEVLTYLQKYIEQILTDEFLRPQSPHMYNIEDVLSDDITLTAKLKKLKTLLTTCHKQKKQVLIFGDYDADGITATAIMWETLTFLGFTVLPFIPNRAEYGYGLSIEAIKYVKKKFNPYLIITVDNGVMAHDAVSYAKKEHINVIISDHHHIDTKKGVPDANIVFHTTTLSGSGIAYFLAKKIASFFNKNTQLTRYFETEFPILATIGTIADIAPMTGYSRSIVKHGLLRFPYSTRIALVRLLENFSSKKTVSTTDVGFSISPIINVFGRIGDPMDALRLLCSHKVEKVNTLLLKASDLTKKRQEMISMALRETKGQTENSHSVCYVSENYHEGIIGLIASQVVKKYNKPACIITKSGDMWKGSMRSTGADIAVFLGTCTDIVESAGGHVMAGGFSLKQKNIAQFISRFNVFSKKNSDREKNNNLYADIKIPIALSSLEVAEFLEECAPFGAGNPEIVFVSTARLFSSTPVGKSKTHAKIKMQDEEGAFYDGIYFNGHTSTLPLINKQVDCVYTVSINYWNGRARVERIIKAIFVV